MVVCLDCQSAKMGGAAQGVGAGGSGIGGRFETKRHTANEGLIRRRGGLRFGIHGARHPVNGLWRDAQCCPLKPLQPGVAKNGGGQNARATGGPGILPET